MVVVSLYLLPFMIAYLRDAKGTAGVFVVNFFLGWTLLGWVGALAWAVTSERRPALQSKIPV